MQHTASAGKTGHFHKLLLLFIVLGVLWLIISGCLPVPANQFNISLSEAIALSKSQNIQKVVVDAGSGTMIITTAVTGAPLKITDTSGSPVDVTNGTLLVANIDSLNIADLQAMGFVLPNDYSTNAATGSGLGNLLLIALPFLLLFILIYMASRSGRSTQNQVMGFARSRARLITGNRPQVTFADVAGEETLLAGHAAEEMMFNEVTTGPHSDLKQVTALARKMVTEFGMSQKLGLRTYGVQTVPGYLGFEPPEEKDYSEQSARQIDEEINKVIEDAHQVAKKVLQENRPRLVHIAEKLLAKENLEGADLKAAFTEPLSPVAKAADSVPA